MTTVGGATAGRDPAIGHCGSVDDLRSAIRLLHASSEVLIVGGTRAATLQPWMRTWFSALVAMCSLWVGLTVGVGAWSWAAFAVPTAMALARLLRRRGTTLTFRRGSRWCELQRGATRFVVAWDRIELEPKVASLLVRAQNGHLSIPIRRGALASHLTGAVALLNQFTSGTGGPPPGVMVVEAALCDSFDLTDDGSRLIARAVDAHMLVPAGVAALLSAAIVGAAAVLAKTDPAGFLLACLFAAPAATVFVMPVYTVVFERRDQRLRLRWYRTTALQPFDLQVAPGDGDGRPEQLLVTAGTRVVRLLLSPAASVNLFAAAELVRSFSGRPTEHDLTTADTFAEALISRPRAQTEVSPPPADDATVVRVLPVVADTAEGLVLRGRLRWRHRPPARSGWFLFLTSLSTAPLLFSLLGSVGLALPGLVGAVLLTRFLIGLQRVNIVLLRDGRTVLWRLRDVAVAVTWTRIEPTQAFLDFVTEAGLLRVRFRQRTSTREAESCAAALERRFSPAQPQSSASTSPSTRRWPDGFITFLENFHPRTVTTERIVFDVGRRSVPGAIVIGVLQLLLAFWLYTQSWGPFALAVVCLVLAGWPLFSAAGQIVIARGTPTAVIRWRSYEEEGSLLESLTAWSMEYEGNEEHGLLMKIDGGWFGLPGRVNRKDVVAAARRALLEYAGADARAPEASG